VRAARVTEVPSLISWHSAAQLGRSGHPGSADVLLAGPDQRTDIKTTEPLTTSCGLSPWKPADTGKGTGHGHGHQIVSTPVSASGWCRDEDD